MTKNTFAGLRADYERLWAAMHVTKQQGARSQALRIIANRYRYQAVAERTGVPWFVIGCLHMRESDGDFRTWLHNGDPMRNASGNPVRTVQVPKGRPPDPSVTWEEGAVDALIYEQFDEIKHWSPARVAYAMETFNGFGYRGHGIPSPYLWGGTSVQQPGKFVRDHVYDASVMDTQIGGMAVLRVLMDIRPDEVKFDDAALAPVTVEFVLLKRGASGPDVVRLQELLKLNGATLVIDGDFGSDTERKVKFFQATEGLAVDGVVGPKTWRALVGDTTAPAVAGGATQQETTT